MQSSRFGKDGKIPVLVWQRFGAGQVLFHATDELWQWRQGREDSVYGRYWGQAIRQLSRAKLLGDDRSLHLSSDRPVYTLGETVKLQVRAPGGLQDGPADESLVAIVERPGGERRRVPLQKIGEETAEFEANWSSDLVGSYRPGSKAPAVMRRPMPAGSASRFQIGNSASGQPIIRICRRLPAFLAGSSITGPKPPTWRATCRLVVPSPPPTRSSTRSGIAGSCCWCCWRV